MAKRKTFSVEYLREHWGSGKPIIYKDKKYRVGLMSYGDYFLEPLKKGFPLGKGETTPFERGTKWLKKAEKKPYLYEIDRFETKLLKVI